VGSEGSRDARKQKNCGYLVKNEDLIVLEPQWDFARRSVAAGHISTLEGTERIASALLFTV